MGLDSKTNNRVVITGIGMANPLGLSKEEVWAGVLEGKSGFTQWPPEHVQDVGCPIYGRVEDETLISKLKNRRSVKYMGKDALLSIKPAGDALVDAGWEKIENAKEEIALYVATGLVAGCNEEMMAVFQDAMDENGFSVELFAKNALFRINPLTSFTTMSNMPACHISIEYGLTGENLVFTSRTDQCANAIAEAYYSIKAGDFKYSLVGGTESKMNLEGIVSLKTDGAIGEDGVEIDEEIDFTSFGSKPFDKGRMGAVASEGAAFLFLETYESAIARDAHIYAEIMGVGHCNFVSSEEESVVNAATKAVERMLDNSGTNIQAVDFVVSSASSSVEKDKQEGKALERLLKNTASDVWCPKANYGEIGIASFSTATAFAALAISKGELPPSVGTENCEFEIKLTPNTVLEKKINNAVAVTFDSPHSTAAILLRRVME